MKQLIATIIFLVMVAFAAHGSNSIYTSNRGDKSHNSNTEIKDKEEGYLNKVGTHHKEQKKPIDIESNKITNRLVDQASLCVVESDDDVHSLQTAKAALIKAYKLRQINIKVNEHDLYHSRIKVIVN